MKRLLFLFSCLVLSNMLYAQNIKLNLITSISHEKPSIYTYPNSYIDNYYYEQVDDGLEDKTPIGFSASLQSEFVLNQQFSFFTGLGYARKSVYPNYRLGGSFAPLIDIVTNDVLLFDPYLKQHTFNLMTIPLGFRVYPIRIKFLQPYLGFSVENAFRFSESETYKSLWESSIWFEGEQSDDIVQKETDFAFYSTMMKAEFGIAFSVSKKLNILLNTQFGLWEHKAPNQKNKESGAFLYEENVVLNSQKSLGLGIQRLF